MAELYKFKVFCSTDNQWEYIWSETAPTVCPINAGHSIISSSVSINENDKLKIITINHTNSPFRQKKESLYFDTSGGNITVDLMKAKKGKNRVYYFKKCSALNTVILDPYESELIDGQLTKKMTGLNEFLILTSDGTSWSTHTNQKTAVVAIDEITQENLDITGEKGEILVDNGDELGILSPGLDGQMLMMDSTSKLGVKWANNGLEFIEMWTTSNSSATSITTTYKELLLSATRNITSSSKWSLGTTGYPRIVYTGTNTQRFMCIANLSIDSNTNSNEFLIAYSINNIVQSKEVLATVEISGKAVEVTLVSTLNLNTNDTVSIYCKDTGGSSTVSIIRINLIAHSMNGPTGANGTDGQNGADGAPGSGSSLIIKDKGINVANTPHNALNFIGSGVSVADGKSGIANVTINNIFGSQYHYAESLGLSTTTINSWIQKLKLTTSSLPSGNYKLTWSAEFSNENSDKSAIVRLEQNDTTEIAYNGSAGKLTNGVTPWHSFSGNRQLALSGVNTFDIDFMAGNNTAQIKRANIELFRIN